MATVALFHSILGFRKVEMEAATRMRGAGHTVVAPDLYSGRTATSIDEGFELMSTIGWKTICSRARAALDLVSETAVLAGHSMGTGVVGRVWPDRITCGGVVLLHGLAQIPHNVRHGVPASVHIADPDEFAPPQEIAKWAAVAQKAGVRADVFSYPNVGHFYTDEASSDHDQTATEQTWERVLNFLAWL